MKLRFILLFVIAAAGTCFSQSSPKEKSADSLYNIAKNLWNSNRDSAKYYFQLTLKISQEAGYQKGIANAWKGLGYISKSNAEAIQYYTKALTIREEIKDSLGIGISLMDISNIYKLVGDKEKSMEYTKRSFKIRKKINDFGGIAQCLIDFGRNELDKGQPNEALKKFKEALYYRIKSREVNGIAFAHVNIADVFLSLKKYDSAIYFGQLAKEEFVKTNNQRNLIWPIIVIAESYFRSGDAHHALKELEHDYKGDHSLRSLALLTEIYETKKEYSRAYAYQKQWIELNNKIQAGSNNEETKKIAADYEFKIHEIQVKKEEEARMAAKNRHDNLEFLIIAVLLIAVFIFIISLRTKVSERTANYLTFTGFLLLFEFLVVLFEPRLQIITRNEPFLILIGNVVIALIITPIHSVVEKKFKATLLKKSEKKNTEHTEISERSQGS